MTMTDNSNTQQPQLECSIPASTKNEKTPRLANELQGAPASLGTVMPMLVDEDKDEDEETIITNIRATNVALSLGRFPVGFYIAVRHSGLEWRTGSKRLSLNNDVLEWDGPIPIPSNLSATVCLVIFASFELQPMLGSGEQLRQTTVTVEQLLNRNAENSSFTFSVNHDVVSLRVTVRQQKRESNNSSASRAFDPRCSTTISQDPLENATTKGHSALSRYQKYGGKPDLELAIEHFERALNVCPLDHPCRAVAEANMAMAKFIHCRVSDTAHSLDVPLTLYRHALSARPVGHPDRPSTLMQLATVHFARFERGQDEIDAIQAESLLHEAMDLSLEDSYENRAAISMLQLHVGHRVGHVHPVGQSSVTNESVSCLADEDAWSFSVQLLNRFEQFGNLDDLQRAISVLEASVRSTSVWEEEYFAMLTNLGVALSCRFDHLGELNDLEQAIARFGDAVDLTPNGHPDKPDRLSNHGNSILTRFKQLGELSDLERAISRYRDAVDLRPDGHSSKPRCLSNLGVAWRARFERLGELRDLGQAISKYRNAVDLTPDGHPGKPGRLSNLGNSLFTRFERLGELSDLEQAILKNRDAVDLTPDGHPDKPMYLNNLGSIFLARFARLGELSDLEEAVSRHRDAIYLTPDGHPDKPTRLSNLGIALKTRFGHLGQLGDLTQAISRHRDAVGLTPNGHPDKPGYLNNLGNSFRACFERFGALSDLEEAISQYRDAVDLTPDGHPDKPRYRNNLGMSFKARFERLGELSDLEQAISTHRDAVDLIPDGHPERPVHLSNLGTSFLARFENLGELGDLEQAISRYRDAVDLTPDGHPKKRDHLSNLGNSFRARFGRFGELSDLEQAISRYRDVVELIPDGHPDKPRCQNSLATALRFRFDRLGELSDLEQAILRHKDAADLTTDGHPERPTYLSGLGTSFFTRFGRFGELRDLEQAISTHRDAVDLVPDGHPERPVHVSNLGTCFLTRFGHLGELSDLEQAISRHTDAVDFTPDDHPNKPFHMNNLGNTFNRRFGRTGELSDLEKAISKYSDALDLTPDGHPEKLGYLNNLGDAFITRFRRLGELGDLERALSMHEDVVDLIPDDHSDRPIYLSNLGNSLFTRFKHLGRLVDLEQAISRYRNAIDLTPDGHPDKPGHLNKLGNAFTARFKQFRELGDLEHALSLYSYAACASTGSVTTRFRASQQWISCAHALGHRSLLQAYTVAIGHLPQLAWIGLPLPRRYRELIQAADVVREAAAAALDSGLPETAVEWLEQGRSIVWGELFHLRSSYEELSASHPEHGCKLRQLSAALEHASFTRDKSLSSPSKHAQSAEYCASRSLEQEAERHRMLAIERDKLLQDIRGLPGFERFLLHKEFSQLRASAHSGPVVILNAAEHRCDALIAVTDVEHVIHVPLPNCTLGRSTGLQNAVKTLLGDVRVIQCGGREGKRHHWRGVNWESVLSVLWNGIVKPVLDALDYVTLGDLSRIFWCPTGPFAFLPIHAAGLYGTQSSGPGCKVSDFVVSSYVPTISILAPPPKPDVTSSSNIRLLAVPQPPSDGLSRLPGVDTELKYIRAVLQDSRTARTTLLESSVGTVEEVLSLMKEADWVHFACHGIQDAANPTDSGLCLADQRRLQLTDIIALSRPRGGLAFLSACQTAMGDEDLSDEAIHIAAGMLFAGYGGVIGTMWSISDRLAPQVANDVYQQLFQNCARPDHREAARALHDAVGRLRNNKASFDEWLPFIHVGL